MKKQILIYTLLLFTLLSHSQTRLGSTEQEIRKEFSEKTFTSGNTTEDNQKYIAYSDERIQCIHYFDIKGICNWAVIEPLNTGTLNFYVETYNKNYVIINDTEWKMYTKNGIAKIVLIYPDNGKDPYFGFSPIK